MSAPPLLEERELTSAVAVANQMVNILTEQNVQRSLKQLLPDDMVIDPNLGDISFMDFARAEEALAIGRRAAEAAVQRLRALSNPVAYAQLQARRQVPPDPTAQALPLAARGSPAPPAPAGHPAPAVAAAAGPGRHAGRHRPQPAGAARHRRLRTHRSADRRPRGSAPRRVQAQRGAWASSRVRFGLEMYSNFSRSNHFSLVGMHVASWLNSWGAELRSVARIGSRRGLSSEFYQPLGVASPWFGERQIGYEAGSDDVFNQGQRALRQASSLSGDATRPGPPARQLWRCAHRRGWPAGQRGGADPSPGRWRSGLAPPRPAPFIELHTDTLDSLAFPSQGHWLTARVEWLQPSGQAQAVNATVIALKAFQWGEWAGQLYGERAHAESGTACSLGGYLRLSGTPDRSLVAENVTLARLVMARRLGHMPVALGGAVRVGFSLEMGGVSGGPLLAPLTDTRWHQAVSGFPVGGHALGPSTWRWAPTAGRFGGLPAAQAHLVRRGQQALGQRKVLGPGHLEVLGRAPARARGPVLPRHWPRPSPMSLAGAPAAAGRGGTSAASAPPICRCGPAWSPRGHRRTASAINRPRAGPTGRPPGRSGMPRSGLHPFRPQQAARRVVHQQSSGTAPRRCSSARPAATLAARLSPPAARHPAGKTRNAGLEQIVRGRQHHQVAANSGTAAKAASVWAIIGRPASGTVLLGAVSA